MSLFSNSDDRIIIEEYPDEESEIIHIGRSSSDGEGGGGVTGSGSIMEAEKRIRREIANSNERRRMQSINAGFQSLRTLLPHHEGEKLSKAAILQQTAEYIYSLEQEKTRLLSQNCQLKRLVNQHEGGEVLPTKKRKAETLMLPTVQAISESSDEGLGSMSPEPVAALLSVVNSPAQQTQVPSAELLDLKVQLERERRLRIMLEEQVRNMESQVVYPERMREMTVQFQHQELIEHTIRDSVVREIDNVRDSVVTVSMIQETQASVGQMQVIQGDIQDMDDIQELQEIQDVQDLHDMQEVNIVSSDNVPTIAQTQTIITCSPSASRSQSPINMVATSPQIKVERIIVTDRPASPTIEIVTTTHPRLTTVLEAATKAEPKVEVERMPSPAPGEETNPQARLYLASTSRQNLETIVEAIRHLEGDHMFREEQPTAVQKLATTGRTIVLPRMEQLEPAQEVPLALTHKPARHLQVEMNPFLQFHSPHAASVQQQQQCRPGVIVVKQNS